MAAAEEPQWLQVAVSAAAPGEPEDGDQVLLPPADLHSSSSSLEG